MSSNLFDAGDFQRLDRERTLIEQHERIPPEEDRSPVSEATTLEENPYDLIFDGLLDVLRRRLL